MIDGASRRESLDDHCTDTENWSDVIQGWRKLKNSSRKPSRDRNWNQRNTSTTSIDRSKSAKSSQTTSVCLRKNQSFSKPAFGILQLLSVFASWKHNWDFKGEKFVLIHETSRPQDVDFVPTLLNNSFSISWNYCRIIFDGDFLTKYDSIIRSCFKYFFSIMYRRWPTAPASSPTYPLIWNGVLSKSSFLWWNLTGFDSVRQREWELPLKNNPFVSVIRVPWLRELREAKHSSSHW